MSDRSMSLKVGGWVYQFSESADHRLKFQEKIPLSKYPEPPRSLVMSLGRGQVLWPRCPEVQVYQTGSDSHVTSAAGPGFLEGLAGLLFNLERQDPLASARTVLRHLRSLQSQADLTKTLIRPLARSAALCYFWGWAGVDQPNPEDEFHRFLGPALPREEGMLSAVLAGMWDSGNLVVPVVGQRYSPWTGKVLGRFWEKNGKNRSPGAVEDFLFHYKPFVQSEPDNPRDSAAMGVYIQNPRGQTSRIGYLRKTMAAALRKNLPGQWSFPARWETLSQGSDGEWDITIRLTDPCPAY